MNPNMPRKTAPWRAVVSVCLIAAAIGLISWLAFGNVSQNIPGNSTTATSTPTSTAITIASSTATSTATTTGTIGTKPKPITMPVPTTTPNPIPVIVIPAPVVVQPADALAEKFGISTGDTLPGMTSFALAQELNDIASLGVGWVRLDMAWNDIQPSNSTSFNWSNMDRVVAAAEARNIKLLPVLDYTPRWDIPAGCTQQTNRCSPADPALFAAFAAAAVKRYAPEGVTDWEIWNEPNSEGFWQPQADPSDYVKLLKLTYAAIKAQDPSAVVITGGLSPAATGNGNLSPTDFLTRIYADGAEGYFDAVGDHPYSYPAMPLYPQSWNAWQQMASTNPSLRSIMIANGDANKQIWATEYGAPTGGPGLLESSATDTSFFGHPDHVTEAVQAQMMTEAITTTENTAWAGPLFWYSYQDLGTSTTTNENFFGIIRYDGSTKPAYDVMKALLE